MKPSKQRARKTAERRFDWDAIAACESGVERNSR